jgi:hypothetical protein
VPRSFTLVSRINSDAIICCQVDYFPQLLQFLSLSAITRQQHCVHTLSTSIHKTFSTCEQLKLHSTVLHTYFSIIHTYIVTTVQYSTVSQFDLQSFICLVIDRNSIISLYYILTLSQHITVLNIKHISSSLLS